MRWISFYALFVRQGNVSEGSVNESKQRLLGRLWVHGPSSMLEVYCTALTYSDILEIVMAFGPGVDIRSLPLTWLRESMRCRPSSRSSPEWLAGLPMYNFLHLQTPSGTFSITYMISHAWISICPKRNVTNASMTPSQCDRYVLCDVANCKYFYCW